MHILLAVTNDISTDQRISRIAHTLQKMQAQVTLIGRHYPQRMKYNDTFHAIRMTMIFNKGPLFYAEYNLRLFLRLMFMKADLFVANDLDTLPAVFLASKIRHKILLYDSHEYFTEVPELVNRKSVRKKWEWIENQMLPHIRHAYTVSNSIALAYKQKYGIDMKLIRNLPFKRKLSRYPAENLRSASEKIIIYQGSLNMGRGLELAIRAILYTHNVRLVIIGKGDLENELKKIVISLGLSDRVIFTGRIDAARLCEYTVQADLGISLEEDLGLNYRFSLPNKVFDYIQAEVPVLVSDLPEMRTLVEYYDVGMITRLNTPEELGALFTRILGDEGKLRTWKANLKKAAGELCWEQEEDKLETIYRNAISDRVS